MFIECVYLFLPVKERMENIDWSDNDLILAFRLAVTRTVKKILCMNSPK